MRARYRCLEVAAQPPRERVTFEPVESAPLFTTNTDRARIAILATPGFFRVGAVYFLSSHEAA